ncbi:MAG TPA: sulfotransferase family 2 domain-containing protein [Gammaproteobacteria bacterium]|nr:sulfotransferase family 2 domain-containing protein [Gammaproteobacteria bacterium]
MIVCHKYRFIFLKTNKTAGTSIEIALSRFCGPDDIITPISPADEMTRQNLGYRGPQNYLAAWYQYNPRDIFRFLRKGRKKRRFYNHISAKMIKARIGNETWNNYFKFCIERNPWDKTVSLYYWKYKKTPQPPSFSEYIHSDIPLRLKQHGIDVYTIDGKVVVDRICRYENLDEELEETRKLLGLPDKLELPRSKSQFRKNRKNYRDYYGNEEKSRVSELFADELRLFDYGF